MTILDDLRTRPLTLDDVGDVIELFHRYDQQFFGEPLMDADDIASEFSAPDIDLTTSSRGYWTSTGELVATVFLSPRGHLDVQFADGWDTPDLKDQLVDFGEQLARSTGMDSISTFVADDDTDGARLLRRARLHAAPHLLDPRPRSGDADRRPGPARGYAVRPFTMADAEPTYRVITRRLRGVGRPAPVVRGLAGGDPRSRERRPVGLPGRDLSRRGHRRCIVFDSAGEAWVAQLAVDQAHRHRGVAQQLLAETYAAARQRGVPHAGLSTDTRTGALDLYLRLGMRVKFTLDNVELDASRLRFASAPFGRVTYSVGARRPTRTRPMHSPSCYGDVP